MALSSRFRPALPFLSLLLLFGAARPCLALYELADVSKQRAKELGITVTSKARTDDVWVHVEFRTAGTLKEFRWADLDVTQDGKRLVSAPLAPRKPAVLRVPVTTAETLQLEFYIAPSALPNSSVTIFVGDGLLGGTGYRVPMKDYLPAVASR